MSPSLNLNPNPHSALSTQRSALAPRRAVFLDRDGTVNEEVGYIRSRHDIRLIPRAATAIRALNQAGWLVIVITNQSGVGRGYLTAEELEAAHARLLEQLAAEGAQIDAIFYCPHVPDDACACRKPEVELIRRAERQFGIDLTASWMIGDKDSDLDLGRNAGCRTALVLTGYGAETATTIDPKQADLVAPDLFAAVSQLLYQVAPDQQAQKDVERLSSPPSLGGPGGLHRGLPT